MITFSSFRILVIFLFVFNAIKVTKMYSKVTLSTTARGGPLYLLSPVYLTLTILLWMAHETQYYCLIKIFGTAIARNIKKSWEPFTFNSFLLINILFSWRIEEIPNSVSFNGFILERIRNISLKLLLGRVFCSYHRQQIWYYLFLFYFFRYFFFSLALEYEWKFGYIKSF